MWSEALEGGAVELLLMVWMSDADDGLGSLLEGLAVEVHRTVLGYEPVDVVAGGHDTGAGGEDGSDLADALVGHRGHGDDGLAALGHGGSVDEVDLAADTGVELGAEGVSAYLAGEVHLEGGVDGCHLGVLGDDVGVVGVADVHHGHHRVVVDEVIDLLGAHEEGGYHLAAVDALLGSVDYAFPDEGQDAVGEHLGVDTEVLVVTELGQYGVGNGADTHLQGGSVLDQGGAVASDGCLDGRGLGEVSGLQLGVALHEGVDHRQGDDGVTPCAGYVLVDHCDDVLCAFDGGQGGVHGGTHGYVTVLVGEGYLDHGHVAGQYAAAVESLGLAQEDGDVVGIAGLYALAHIAAYEECLMEEDSLILGVGVGSGALGVEVVDPHVPEFACIASAAESVNEHLGGCGHTAEMNMVTGLHDLDGLVRTYKMDIFMHMVDC